MALNVSSLIPRYWTFQVFAGPKISCVRALMEHKVSLEGSFGIWKGGTHACMCIMLKQEHVCNTWNPNLMKEIFFIYLFFLNATPKCIKQIFFADIIHVKKNPNISSKSSLTAWCCATVFGSLLKTVVHLNPLFVQTNHFMPAIIRVCLTLS